MLVRYPTLSEQEFSEACQKFETRCFDNLYDTDWLSVKWDNHMLKITQLRLKLYSGSQNDSCAIPLAKLNSHEVMVNGTVDEEENEICNDDDNQSLSRWDLHTMNQDRYTIEFDILLSQSYCVPVLWFLPSFSRTARLDDLEMVYCNVIARGANVTLRTIGVMGGISLANHPLSDKPSFFVHPCNTGEAMLMLNDGSQLDPFQYLLLWFGVVAAVLGLHVPTKIASSFEVDKSTTRTTKSIFHG